MRPDRFLAPPMTFPSAAERSDTLGRHGILASIELTLIRAYQGIRGGRPSSCRYWPTCSSYAAEAIERHGVWRGNRLVARRLGRCTPWGGRGADPVPD